MRSLPWCSRPYVRPHVEGTFLQGSHPFGGTHDQLRVVDGMWTLRHPQSGESPRGGVVTSTPTCKYPHGDESSRVRLDNYLNREKDQ